MKIRKVKFERHPIFGDLELDFTDKSGKVIDTIILAGENGVGKSVLLNTFFELANLNVHPGKNNEKRFFEIQFSNTEIDYLRDVDGISAQFMKGFENNSLQIAIDYNIKDSWDQIGVRGKFADNSGEMKLFSGFFSNL